jgi:hypothetical protein
MNAGSPYLTKNIMGFLSEPFNNRIKNYYSYRNQLGHLMGLLKRNSHLKDTYLNRDY